MTRTIAALLIAALTAAAPPLSFAADPSPREQRMAEALVPDELPRDLEDPEGRTRWDLTSLVPRAAFVRAIGSAGRSVTLADRPEGPGAETTPRRERIWSDPSGGDAALRWGFPDFRGAPDRPDVEDGARGAEGRLRPGAREILDLEERAGGAPDRLRIETSVEGIGWVHLPSGPREVVLQRALILREAHGRRGYEPDTLLHRFIDPREGVVAEISGPATADGRGRRSVGSIVYLEATITGASNLVIRVGELDEPPLSTVFYGWDRGANTPISALTPEAYANVGQLVAASSWNFSANTSGTEVAATTTPLTRSATCNFSQCGYDDPNSPNTGDPNNPTEPKRQFERTDKGFADPNTLVKINDTIEREDRPGDVTIWLRAGSQFEGKSGSLGDGESRFCYVSQGGVTRTPVPLWRFPHDDPAISDPNRSDWYFTVGDSWASGTFNCEQNLFNQICGAPQFLDKLYVKACGTHQGNQRVEALKAGVVTLPSGHTFNALLVRNIADFCVYTGSSCLLFVASEVRTVNLLWQVPYLGTVARIQSAQNVSDPNTFTTVAETDFKFGLYPPRTIAVTGTTDTSLTLSWDPGLDTHRIDAYRVWWDTDSGGASPYAFNSLSNPGQVSFAGTSATISGLLPGTAYHVTVTARSTFADPTTGALTTYESLLYPTQVSGDPSFVYPVEVTASTTCAACVPSAEVTGVTAETTPGGTTLCWNPVTDPHLDGYEILGAATAQTDAGYASVGTVGLQTCWEGSPSSTYFLVVARGPGGNGPWGHYGR